MTLSISYLVEKHFLALHELAVGERDARARLGEAYGRFWTIRPSEYPVHLHKARIDIDATLTRLPGREGYIIPDNLRKMKNTTASKVCSMIFDLYFDLVQVEEAKQAAKKDTERTL